MSNGVRIRYIHDPIWLENSLCNTIYGQYAGNGVYNIFTTC